MNKPCVTLALLSLLVLAACAKKEDANKEGASKSGSSGTPVTVARAESRTVELLEETVGSMESLADPVIAAEVPGKVLEIRAVVGNEVKAGQVLAVMDGRDVTLSRQAAQAEARRAETLSGNQGRNLERLKQLREKNFISQAALDDATAQSRSSREQLASARAQLGLAERNANKATVLSPISGRVETQIVVQGQYVKVGDPMFQVVALKKLRARLPFPETLSGRLQRGMKVLISSPGEETQLSGKIEEIRPMAGGNNRSFDVFVTFNNPGTWKPGATVSATVVLGEHQNAVVVPEESVVLRPAGQVVYVVQGDKVEQRLVQVGIIQQGMAEILGGLKLDETVAVDGAGFLTDQAPVIVSKIIQPAASADAMPSTLAK